MVLSKLVVGFDRELWILRFQNLFKSQLYQCTDNYKTQDKVYQNQYLELHKIPPMQETQEKIGQSTNNYGFTFTKPLVEAKLEFTTILLWRYRA